MQKGNVPRYVLIFGNFFIGTFFFFLLTLLPSSKTPLGKQSLVLTSGVANIPAQPGLRMKLLQKVIEGIPIQIPGVRCPVQKVFIVRVVLGVRCRAQQVCTEIHWHSKQQIVPLNAH
jgi:hypothetical protein